jgi:hypothetical protein
VGRRSIADRFVVLVVPNVKVEMGAQHSIPPVSCHGLLRRGLRGGLEDGRLIELTELLY